MTRRVSGLLLTALLFLPGIVYAQDETAAVPSTAGRVKIPVSVFSTKVGGDDAVPISRINDLVHSSIDALGRFDIYSIGTPAADPDIPPDAGPVQGRPYAVTAQTFRVPGSDETHLQMWLYDMRADNLIITDEMVYVTADDASEFMGPLVDWIMGNIPDTLLVPVDSTTTAAGAGTGVGADGTGTGDGGGGTDGTGKGDTGEGTLTTDDAGFQYILAQVPPGNRPKWYFGFAYSPLIPIGGYFKMFHTNANFFPVGFNSYAAVMLWNFPAGKLGIKGNIAYNYQEFKETNLAFTGSLLSTAGSLVYMPPLPTKKFEINAALGAGLALKAAYHYRYDGGGDSLTPSQATLLGKTGFAARWIFWEGFYAEAGLDFDFLVPFHGDVDAYSRINIGFGWKW